MSYHLAHNKKPNNTIWPNSGHLLKNKFLFLPFHLSWYRPLCTLQARRVIPCHEKHGIQFILCSQTEGHCAVFLFLNFLFFRFCSEQYDVGAENEKKKQQAVVFLIYVFANVLISNMLHKVECVFQPDELSLWRGERRKRRIESVGGGRREG